MVRPRYSFGRNRSLTPQGGYSESERVVAGGNELRDMVHEDTVMLSGKGCLRVVCVWPESESANYAGRWTRLQMATTPRGPPRWAVTRARMESGTEVPAPDCRPEVGRSKKMGSQCWKREVGRMGDWPTEKMYEAMPIRNTMSQKRLELNAKTSPFSLDAS